MGSILEFIFSNSPIYFLQILSNQSAAPSTDSLERASKKSSKKQNKKKNGENKLENWKKLILENIT